MAKIMTGAPNKKYDEFHERVFGKKEYGAVEVVEITDEELREAGLEVEDA